MSYDSSKHHRRSVRLPDYSYSAPGAYFITICTYQRDCLFGQIRDRKMHLSPDGDLVQKCWDGIPQHFAHVELGSSVVMPDHFHGILILKHAPDVPIQPIVGRDLRHKKMTSGSLPTVVRSFKSICTSEINKLRSTPGGPVWQRGYYERIIRDAEAFRKITQYIWDNPKKWSRM